MKYKLLFTVILSIIVITYLITINIINRAYETLLDKNRWVETKYVGLSLDIKRYLYSADSFAFLDLLSSYSYELIDKKDDPVSVSSGNAITLNYPYIMWQYSKLMNKNDFVFELAYRSMRLANDYNHPSTSLFIYDSLLKRYGVNIILPRKIINEKIFSCLVVNIPRDSNKACNKNNKDYDFNKYDISLGENKRYEELRLNIAKCVDYKHSTKNDLCVYQLVALVNKEGICKDLKSYECKTTKRLFSILFVSYFLN